MLGLIALLRQNRTAYHLSKSAPASQKEPGVNPQAIDPRMIEALEGASSLQLYQLKAIIEGMLTDPHRGLAARADLHLG